ncbi:MAG: SDR family oxidoreductase [Cyanobacteriota bacterium]|nr:SDR family oxidoreductase [Cyanobacteriota bacterium]
MTVSADQIPAQSQERKPGLESKMDPPPQYDRESYRGSNKLEGKVALVTGGDSGIGRSVAILYAKEGADVAVSYLDEHEDAKETQRFVQEQGQKCLLLPGDISDDKFCFGLIQKVIDEFGKLDILVNNAAEQYEEDGKTLENIDAERLKKIFGINIYSMFYLTKAAIPYLKEGSTIINTTSINAYKGNSHLISYSTTKGAILAFTRSIAEPLLEKGIRVNAVAPGPIWTPFIPSTFDPDHVKGFGNQVPMKRPGQPVEVATCFVFLASEDSSYLAGQVLHPNGGVVVNG